jgi:hypothetical protein
MALRVDGGDGAPDDLVRHLDERGCDGGEVVHSDIIHPKGSSARPSWMATSDSRSRSVTSPGVPSPIVHVSDPVVSRPIGAITAAVPHANASVTRPA